MGKWEFEPLRGGPRRNPQEAELFKNKDADEGEYAGNDYLVREVIQNALDARSSDFIGPVRVRFSLFGEDRCPDKTALGDYFLRLREPLARFDIGCDRQGVPDLPKRFLVCEDFGTRGLEGDEKLFSDPTDKKIDEDFYWFWRNIGLSAKSNEDLGRWGLGKTVFRAVSQIRSMLGLTVRQSDGKRLLMGQTVLQPHQHGQHEYHPEGYWCDDDSKDFPLPITRSEEVDRFCRHWHLSRVNEPGLSVVSPFVPPELNERRILRAVVVNFFVRIIRRELVVEVSGPTMPLTTVDANSIASICSDLEWNKNERRYKLHAPPPIAFVREFLSLTPTVETPVMGTRIMPSFADDGFADEMLSELVRFVLFRLDLSKP